MEEGPSAAFQFAGQDIPGLLAAWATHQPDKVFLHWAPATGPHRSWTYAQFWNQVRAVAAGLCARGIRAGDRLLLHADNCPEGVITWYACATLGAITVTTNTRSVADEIDYFVTKTGCVAAVTQSRHAALVASAAPSLTWLAVIPSDVGDGDPVEVPTGPPDVVGFDELVVSGEEMPTREPDPMAPVGILFTSGTTGRPKAVVHTHANALWAGRVGPTTARLTSDDTCLVYLPFFHVNAQSWSIWSALGVGATVVLQPKFSASRFWDVVTTYGATHIALLPFVINAIASRPIPADHPLKIAVFGLTVPELESFLGVRVVPAFGMTETVTAAIGAGPGPAPAPYSMGTATPGYEVLIVEPETGEVCVDGRPGELWIRGTRGIQLFLEYHDDLDAMDKSFTADGWFRTGDIVKIGEGGTLVYTERDSDMLKVGGENLSSREVEDVCRQVPGVADVAVVGLPDPMLSEVPVAFIIPTAEVSSGGVALQEAIIDACRRRLSDFKVPRAVHLVADFPRATLDKVAKNKLRELAKAGNGAIAPVRFGAPPAI